MSCERRDSFCQPLCPASQDESEPGGRQNTRETRADTQPKLMHVTKAFLDMKEHRATSIRVWKETRTDFWGELNFGRKIKRHSSKKSEQLFLLYTISSFAFPRDLPSNLLVFFLLLFLWDSTLIIREPDT